MQTTIALSLLAMGISTIAVIRANRGEQIRDEFSDAHGDVPTLPEDFRTGSRDRLGGREHDGPRLVTRYTFAHRDSVNNR